jgi:Nucleotidyl transferase AbiEii toxin, Type IV TA system
LIHQVNSKQVVIDTWTFGGGTAMMLQIGHRESHDVDIFLQDPQLLPFLDPQKQDFQFDVRPSGYNSDGSRFIKIAFEDIGEIDFIVAPFKTKNPTIQKEVEGEDALLETIPEIIAKKIVYRGSSIKPRDIFDIAAASEQYSDSIVAELGSYKDDVRATLKTMEGLNPKFVNAAIAELMIRPAFSNIASTALERAKRLLQAV